MASTTLFPPILNSYLPAFKTGESCKIYFNTSDYNTLEDFKDVHISIIRQDNNRNILDPLLYPNGIKLKNAVQKDSKGTYVELSSSDIFGGWEKGSIYKIQLRFANAIPEDNDEQSSWLVNNSSKFSEWSAVTTTKAIGDLKMLVQNFESTTNSTENETRILYITNLEFNGSFDNSDDTSESLKSFTALLFDKDKNLLESSGEIISNGNSVLNYPFKTMLSNGANYYLGYRASTRNYYQMTNEKGTEGSDNYEPGFMFNLQEITNDTLNVEITSSDDDMYFDEENGCITVHVKNVNSALFSGNVNIQRSDASSNFSKWEDVYIKPIAGQTIDFSFHDYSVESGVYYKYSARKVIISSISGNEIYNYGSFEYMNVPIMRVFQSAMLMGENNKTLKLNLNYKMSNYTSNRRDSINESIGGKYPFITRNGRSNYKSFSISGLLTMQMDEEQTFASNSEIYGGESIAAYYSNYNDLYGVDNLYDRTKERLFRKIACEFLEDGKPKLYKSETEGNMIVRVTDVSMTPNPDLGRLIYDFSATIYEICDNTIDNQVKYNLFNLSDYSLDFSSNEIKIGQYINSTTPLETELVGTYICPLYQFQNKNILNYTYYVDEIKSVRIKFNSKPMIIKDINGSDMVGYKIKLNGIEMNIGPNGYYELDPDIDMSTLVLYGDKDGVVKTLDVTIDFIYKLVKDITPTKTIKSRSIDKNIGQYFESTDPFDYIYNVIYYRNYFEWDKEYQKITECSAIQIEAEPNTVIAIKDYKDSGYDKHIIGESGILSFSAYEDYAAIISNFYLYGTYYGEYSVIDKVQLNEEEKGSRNTLYLKDGKFYVWNFGKYIEVTLESDGKIYDKVSRVDLNILYKYTVEKGNYY